MSTLKNKTLLITGGASGIGKLMGKLAIEKGIRTLIIWDVNSSLLEETGRELQSPSCSVRGYVVDVSKTEQIISTANQVRKEVGNIDILINNAGIVVGKYFHEHTHNDIDRSIAINSLALMHIALDFLPGMIERNSGHIVTISSAAGMVGNPKMSVYAASKWAALGWSDSLRIEMEKIGKDIHVTAVTPYYISTGMFAGVKSSIFIPITKPETAARKIIRGIERNALYVRMPLLVYTLQLVKGILPTRLFDFFVGKLLGVYSTMDEFTGRK
ncbi:MAG: SDR family oxidoreductase [Bacteroidota bacterium]|nr:SDR family oxidoreductase [Bacteroidota bacterium]